MRSLGRRTKSQQREHQELSRRQAFRNHKRTTSSQEINQEQELPERKRKGNYSGNSVIGYKENIKNINNFKAKRNIFSKDDWGQKKT